MTRESWVWMPHPAHFICASYWKFFLATYVGGYIVTTVGEMLPDAPVREIIAESRGVALKGQGDARLADYMKKIGYEDLGYERKYETMVFKAMVRVDPNQCCPFVIDGEEVDFSGYNDAVSAKNGHYLLCEKWSKLSVLSDIK